MSLEHSELVAITRTSKRRLVAEIEAFERARGRQWVYGGPKGWSKDELVNAVVRIREGGRP